MKLKNILLVSCLLLICTATKAQITIGSNTPPPKGALLQLRDNVEYTTDETATQGLGMPRVILTSLTIPTGKTLAQTIDGNATTEVWDKDALVGLLVFHADCTLYGQGLYVWTGTEWDKLNEKTASCRSLTTGNEADNAQAVDASEATKN